MRALVRGLASTFADAITSTPLAEPISFTLARQQHHAYVQLLEKLVPSLTELPADDNHPDCCFIEDTAVVVGSTAIVARIGAPSRRGEEGPVATALAALGCTVKHLAPPAFLDGGDVLQLPGSRRVLVGLSQRTNATAAEQLQQHLPHHQVLTVPVEDGLHLKSALTALDGATLLFSDNGAGRRLSQVLAAHPALLAGPEQRGGQAEQSGGDGGSSSSSVNAGASGSISGPWEHVFVLDPVAANVLLVGQHVVMQGGCARSEALLHTLCARRGLQLHVLPRMTEMIKADGALTCCSILLPPP